MTQFGNMNELCLGVAAYNIYTSVLKLKLLTDNSLLQPDFSFWELWKYWHVAVEVNIVMYFYLQYPDTLYSFFKHDDRTWW